MRILVACEFSGIVRNAFLERGHDAWSCDLLPSESPGNHIQGDVLAVLGQSWDMMVAHPPCTHLTIAGAAYRNERQEQRLRAIDFFLRLKDAPIPQIAIENPIPFLDVQRAVGKYDQIINPFQFGQPYRKKICLWLKGVPVLVPTEMVDAPAAGFCIRKTGPRAGRRYNYYFHQSKGAHGRSRFFSGIASAMAAQWSGADIAECDCQNPEPESGVAGVSEDCEIHGRLYRTI